MLDYSNYKLVGDTLYLTANKEASEELEFNDGELVDVFLSPENKYIFFPDWDKNFTNGFLTSDLDFSLVKSIKRVEITTDSGKISSIDVQNIDINIDELDEDDNLVVFDEQNIFSRILITFSI